MSIAPNVYGVDIEFTGTIDLIDQVNTLQTFLSSQFNTAVGIGIEDPDEPTLDSFWDLNSTLGFTADYETGTLELSDYTIFTFSGIPDQDYGNLSFHATSSLMDFLDPEISLTIILPQMESDQGTAPLKDFRLSIELWEVDEGSQPISIRSQFSLVRASDDPPLSDSPGYFQFYLVVSTVESGVSEAVDLNSIYGNETGLTINIKMTPNRITVSDESEITNKVVTDTNPFGHNPSSKFVVLVKSQNIGETFDDPYPVIIKVNSYTDDIVPTSITEWNTFNSSLTPSESESTYESDTTEYSVLNYVGQISSHTKSTAISNEFISTTNSADQGLLIKFRLPSYQFGVLDSTSIITFSLHDRDIEDSQLITQDLGLVSRLQFVYTVDSNYNQSFAMYSDSGGLDLYLENSADILSWLLEDKVILIKMVNGEVKVERDGTVYAPTATQNAPLVNTNYKYKLRVQSDLVRQQIGSSVAYPVTYSVVYVEQPS